MTQEDVIAAMRKLGGKDVRVLDMLDVIYGPLGWWNYVRRVFEGGTVYSHLMKMEETGVVTSRWQEGEVQLDRGKYRRRLYSLKESTDGP